MDNNDASNALDPSSAQHLLRNSSLAEPPVDESAYAFVAIIAVSVIVVFLVVIYYVRREHSLQRRDSDMILSPVHSKRFSRDMEDRFHIVHKSQENLFIKNKMAAKQKNADYGTIATQQSG